MAQDFVLQQALPNLQPQNRNADRKGTREITGLEWNRVDVRPSRWGKMWCS